MTTEAAGSSLRDRKKRDTRARIHRAAVSLALARGVGDVTVEEVAAAAEVSPRTFFNYFATKESALVGEDPEVAEHLTRAVAERPGDESVATALRAVVTARVAALEADDETWRMRRELADRSPELAARLAGAGLRLETALVRAAYARTGTDPAVDLATGVAARVTMAVVRAAFDQHRAAGHAGSVTERLEAAFAAVPHA
ncbi:TetR/AcrR family transcriptional regulator [Phycicoccus duodecadis]|uniref:TetR family transcriptional regulator n=1 Tax=Phycicoccus duodecadis TaxID=173053 RepID=A0A2N3YKQ4_9MICO|nr:TetR family transcriptional regulator [Phycicoccus duodecadis]PKW27435.1 TetR family transcriptional regulator [Phycicoccus duodecadis]